MSEPTARARPLLLRLDRWLPRLMWGVVAVGSALGVASTGFSATETPQTLALVVLSVFFPVCCLRLLVSALVDPAQRTPRLLLLAAVLLWAAGSASLHEGSDLSDKAFPGLAEVFFFPSYVALAAFLLTGRGSRRGPGAKVWLDTLVVCGAVVCVVGSVLASPAGAVFGSQGPALLLQLFYPLLNLALVVLVVGQVLLGVRGRGRDTHMLMGSLVLLAACDLWYFAAIAQGSYYSNVVTDVAYGATFALLVTSACVPASPRPDRARPRTSGALLLGAGSTALAALVLRPADTGGWFVTGPAVLTLLATGLRLTVALREAQGAAEARQLSRTDELTGLLNRRAILADVDEALATGRPVALMLLDLDGFKEVNDSLGHGAGDSVLQVVAARLLRSLPAASRVSRVGGDEFVLMVRAEDEPALGRLARQVRGTVSEPLRIDGLDITLGASVGITVGSGPDTDAVHMLRRADVAMYRAKNLRLGHSFYDAAHDDFSRERLQQIEQLRTGIARGQLRMLYQPQVDAATQMVTSVEALVRWEHPEHGLLSPLAFLPEARRAGLMGPLTLAVFELVVADARRWAAAGLGFTVATNCAPPELLGGRVIPRLLDLVADAGLPPDRLLVEITEDSIMTDPEGARSVLELLRRHHVQAAIDDYGTGFSSLAYLRELPVQELKIDRSFTATMGSDHRSRVIVESTLQMAHAMGLRVVAEGVEDAETAASLVAMGVDVLQGYHVARPMPASEVATWVWSWQTSLRTRAAR